MHCTSYARISTEESESHGNLKLAFVCLALISIVAFCYVLFKDNTHKSHVDICAGYFVLQPHLGAMIVYTNCAEDPQLFNGSAWISNTTVYATVGYTLPTNFSIVSVKPPLRIQFAPYNSSVTYGAFAGVLYENTFRATYRLIK